MYILFVSFEPINSGSSAATCSNMILNGLIQMGHIVEVLTIKRDHYKDLPINENIIEHCQLSYLGEYSSNSGNVTNNNSNNRLKPFLSSLVKTVYRKISVYNYSFFYLKYIKQSVVKKEHYDIIISASDPITSHKAAGQLLKCGVSCEKWIQFWGDPMATDINKKCIWPRFVLKVIEKKIMKGCDRIVYVSPFTLDNQKKLFPSLMDRMTFVLPASEFSEKYEISNNRVMKIVYCGIYHSSIRNIIPLYNAVADNNQYVLKVAGASDISLNNCSNINVLGQIPHSEAIKIEQESDVITCILNNSGTQIPAKAYYYAGTNKPILIIFEDGNEKIVDFLKSLNRFEFAHNDEQSILDALSIIYENREAKPIDLLSPKSVAERLIGEIKS